MSIVPDEWIYYVVFLYSTMDGDMILSDGVGKSQINSKRPITNFSMVEAIANEIKREGYDNVIVLSWILLGKMKNGEVVP